MQYQVEVILDWQGSEVWYLNKTSTAPRPQSRILKMRRPTWKVSQKFFRSIPWQLFLQRQSKTLSGRSIVYLSSFRLTPPRINIRLKYYAGAFDEGVLSIYCQRKFGRLVTCLLDSAFSFSSEIFLLPASSYSQAQLQFAIITFVSFVCPLEAFVFSLLDINHQDAHSTAY